VSSRILILERSTSVAEEIRSAAAKADSQADITVCNRIGAVSEVVASEGPFTTVMAGPSMASRTGLRRLAAFHEEHPWTSLLLFFSDRPDASLREIIQAGADDILRMPFDPDDLVMALERSLEIGRMRMLSGAAKVSALPTSMEPSGGGLAKVFTVSSATGGCGKTFLATNMALYLAKHTRKKVVLVDLDLQFGEVSAALRMRPRYTIHDALEEGTFDLDEHLNELLVQHESGFWVLAAPKDPAEADRIGPVDVTRVLEALRTRCDYIVVDTPAALTEIVLAAFDVSERLYVLATVDLPSVRNLGVFLQMLDKLKISSDNISLILNKAERDVGLDVNQIVRLFPQGFRAILPYAKEVSRSINVGMPVIASDPSSEVSHKLNDCLVELLPEGDRARIGEQVQPAADSNAAKRGFRFPWSRAPKE
jgi:pilus assembly protein CpaE